MPSSLSGGRKTSEMIKTITSGGDTHCHKLSTAGGTNLRDREVLGGKALLPPPRMSGELSCEAGRGEKA